MVQTLCTRAERLSSTPNKKSSEVKHIFNALKKNGYPKQLIQRHFKALQSKADVPAEDKDDTITVVLPYVKGVSEAMRRILARANIRTTFRPCYTLKQHLVKPKDPVSPEKKSNVVYSVPCKSCSAVYVGQTSRQLSTRLKEHKRAVRSPDFNASVLAEHAWNQHHPIDWDEATVLTSESNFQRRLTLELWYIHKSHQTLNRENGGLPVEYTLLMKKHMHA